MSISSELLTLNNTKTAIRTAINNKGGSVGASDTFASYATAIDNLPSGGSGNPLLTSIDVSDFTGTTFNLATSYITDVTIPSGVTSFGNSAFSSCSALTSITIPNSVTSIGQYCFQNSGLTSITIPSSVTSLGHSICKGCTSLTSATILSNCTSVNFFQDCSSLTSVTFGYQGQQLTIEEQCFQNCTSLTTVTIPSNIVNIKAAAFYGCTSLTSVIVEATTPPTINATSNGGAFGNTNDCPIYVPAASVDAYKAASGWSTYASRIFAIEDSILFTPTNGDPAISVKNYELATANYVQSTDVPATIKNGAGALEIEENVTRIGTFAFQSGSSLTSVTIPSTVTRIDNAAFDGCSSLTSVTVNATTPPTLYASVFDNTNNCPIYVPAESVDAYKAANNWSDYASRIEAIPAPPKAVLTLTNNTVVNVPGDGTTILQRSDVIAVATITDIASAVVNEGITATSGIFPPTGAFSGATNLSSVTLPSTLTQISGQAFRNTALASIYIPENVASIAPAAFENCPLASITVDANNTTYSSRNNCNAIIDSGTETIVVGCSSTTIDTDVETIGASSFKGRTSLTDISLSDSVTVIGNSAFSGCTSLETVAIGEGIEEMGVSVFSGCDNLTDITILADAAPDASGEDPFDGCDASITMHVPAASVEAYQAWLNDDLGTAADITVVAISE